MNVNQKDNTLDKDAVEEILLACNRKIKNANGKEDSIEGIKIFKKYFHPANPIYDINKPLPGQKQWTALAFTTWFGKNEETKALISLGASPKILLNDNLSVLHIAASEGRQAMCLSFLQKGADVNQQTSKGLTPLMGACENGHLNVIQTMMPFKPNIMLEDNNKMTCLDYGLKNKHYNVIRFIQYYHLQNKIPLKEIDLLANKKVAKI